MLLPLFVGWCHCCKIQFSALVFPMKILYNFNLHKIQFLSPNCKVLAIFISFSRSVARRSFDMYFMKLLFLFLITVFVISTVIWTVVVLIEISEFIPFPHPIETIEGRISTCNPHKILPKEGWEELEHKWIF